MFGIGPMELLLILVVALLVLGPKRMPELARTLGRGLGEFRRASSELRQSLALDEIQNDLREGMTGGGTIHKPAKKPEADDRPAQAGDELAPGDGAPSVPHPGELPPDADPHAHHDDQPSEDDGDASTEDAEPEPARPTPQAADSELGSVPVGGAAPPKRTDDPSG